MSEQSENENRVEIEERNLWSLKVEGMISDKSTNRKGDSVVRLIDQIVSDRNLDEAIKAVRRNKGAAGVDGMQVEELDRYFEKHRAEIKAAILSKKYKPDPVRRVYIPKANGKKRPLGIPTVKDRVIQQAIAQVLTPEFEPCFSNSSHGYRPGRSVHTAMEQVLNYLNQGYEWVVDLDIEKFFDTVNHDKLISILRKRVEDATTLNLIRRFLRAGIMEDGLVSPPEDGVPQGGPLSPLLSNIYLNEFDQELENRGLRFVRYADDCNIFVKSEMAANRVMASVTSWLERKLFLKESAEKTHVVRPGNSQYLGFRFWKSSDGWQLRVGEDRKARLYDKVRKVTIRKHAVALPLSWTFNKVNEIVRGWINHYRIASMKTFMEEFGAWLRHRIRVIILKQWKKPKTKFVNLMKLNRRFRCNIPEERIRWTADTRKGLYANANGNVVNYLLSPKVLQMPNEKEGRPGLIDPLGYYLESKRRLVSAVM